MNIVCVETTVTTPLIINDTTGKEITQIDVAIDPTLAIYSLLTFFIKRIEIEHWQKPTNIPNITDKQATKLSVTNRFPYKGWQTTSKI